MPTKFLFNMACPFIISILLFESTVYSQVANYLSIEHTVQECRLSCWAACNSMLYNHYYSSQYISQCEQLQLYHNNRFECCLPTGMSNCRYEGVSDIGYNSLHLINKSQKHFYPTIQPSAAEQKLLFDLIKDQIDSNQAIVAQLQVGVNQHLIIISGYLISRQQDTLILINNPALAAQAYISPKKLIYNAPNIHLNYLQYSISKNTNEYLFNQNELLGHSDSTTHGISIINKLNLLIEEQINGTLQSSKNFLLSASNSLISYPQIFEDSFLVSKTGATVYLYQHKVDKQYYYIITEPLDNKDKIIECGLITNKSLLSIITKDSNYMTNPALSIQTFVIPKSNKNRTITSFNNYNNEFEKFKTKFELK